MGAMPQRAFGREGEDDQSTVGVRRCWVVPQQLWVRHEQRGT